MFCFLFFVFFGGGDTSMVCGVVGHETAHRIQRTDFAGFGVRYRYSSHNIMTVLININVQSFIMFRDKSGRVFQLL